MTAVTNPRYQEALREFSRRLRLVHRDAGDPSYDEVAKVCSVSITTVHRYLTGKTLPRWRFVETYLTHYFTSPTESMAASTAALRPAWASARNVLKPIEGPAGGDHMGKLLDFPGHDERRAG